MITVFTTTTCAYCVMVKQFLSLKGKEFKVVNLDDNPKMRQSLYEKTGAMTVPITQIGDQYVIGFNRQRLAEIM
ncbi:MAG: glutaredoxin family protein [bacterium]